MLYLNLWRNCHVYHGLSPQLHLKPGQLMQSECFSPHQELRSGFFPARHFNLSRTWQLHQTNFNDSYPSEGPLVIKQVDRLYPSLDLPRLAYRPGGPSCRQKKQKTTVPKARDRRFLQGQTHAQAHHGRESLHKLGNVKHWILNKPATWTTLAHGY